MATNMSSAAEYAFDPYGGPRLRRPTRWPCETNGTRRLAPFGGALPDGRFGESTPICSEWLSRYAINVASGAISSGGETSNGGLLFRISQTPRSQLIAVTIAKPQPQTAWM